MLLSIDLIVLMGQKNLDAYAKVRVMYATQEHVVLTWAQLLDPQWTMLFLDFNIDVTIITLALKITAVKCLDSLIFTNKFRTTAWRRRLIRRPSCSSCDTCAT
jgi:hypothetical protein